MLSGSQGGSEAPEQVAQPCSASPDGGAQPPHLPAGPIRVRQGAHAVRCCHLCQDLQCSRWRGGHLHLETTCGTACVARVWAKDVAPVMRCRQMLLPQ